MRSWVLHVISRACDSYECAHLMRGISKFVSFADTSPISRTGRAFENTLGLILVSETWGAITMDVQPSLLRAPTSSFYAHHCGSPARTRG